MTAILDFLYLDIERVKSLLSQLSEGLVERVIERSTTSGSAKAGAKIFALAELGGSLIREKAVEQEKSFRDYLYTLFEEAASDAGLLNKYGDLSDPDDWVGERRAVLKGGQLLRITAPARIMDARHLGGRLDSTIKLAAALAGVMVTEEQAKFNEAHREKVLRAVGEGMIGGKQRAVQLQSIGQLADQFFGGQIVFRQFPCGMENGDFNLLGLLSDAEGALQDNADALYAKYGYGVTEWTVVSQIANAPSLEAISADPGFTATEFMEGTRIQRHKFEDFLDKFMGFIQGVGFSSSARYPEISVQPLAIYHRVEADVAKS
jgi:hypothetical protein